MYSQNLFQSRSDDACIVKVPLPPVGSQAGAGYSVAPGMGTSEHSGVQKATCASNSSNPLSTGYKLTLKYDNDRNETKLTPLSIARALESKFDTTSGLSVVPNRASKCLTIETDNEDIFNTLLGLQEIDNMPVEIKAISSTTSKGTFYCEDELDLTNKEETQLENQGVVDLYRIKHTNLYAVTFNRPYLPISLKISTLVFRIRIFIPRPRRCFNCQRYGHTNDTCSHSKVCPKCGVLGHSYEQCTNDPRCYHCSGQHPTSSPDCPRYILEQLVLEHKVRHVVNFDQARSFIYKSNQNIVCQIPRLSLYQTSTPNAEIFDNLNSTQHDLVETLTKTVEAQQSQISLLISEMETTRSYLENKPSISETPQASHTSPNDDHEDIQVTKDSCSESSDVFQEDTNNFYNVSENVIPPPIHQSSPQRDSTVVSSDDETDVTDDDEPSVINVFDTDAVKRIVRPCSVVLETMSDSLLMTYLDSDSTASSPEDDSDLTEDDEPSAIDRESSDTSLNETPTEEKAIPSYNKPSQTQESQSSSQSLSKAYMKAYCLNKLNEKIFNAT